MKIKKESYLFSYCDGHRKLDISKTITARSLKLGQLIEDSKVDYIEKI